MQINFQVSHFKINLHVKKFDKCGYLIEELDMALCSFVIKLKRKNHRKLYRECNGNYAALANRLYVDNDRLIIGEDRSVAPGTNDYDISCYDFRLL